MIRRAGPALMLAGLFLLFAQAVVPGLRASELGEGSPGPQGAETGAWRSQKWLIPLPDEQLLMHATVLRPPGPGPFPLAVINHGSIQSADARASFLMREYAIASQWFLERGYVVVLPLRPGHGETGGPYFEDQGRCDSPDYHQAGLRTADSIEAAVDYFTTQPFVLKSGVVVVGQSAGGWGALAIANRNPGKIRAVVNFSGGRGGHAGGRAGSNCSPDRLVAVAREFGESARVPTLWLYSENDSYFPTALSKRMAEAFQAGGGRTDYHLLRTTLVEGHAFIEDAAAAPLWSPLLAKFLARNQ
jgi:dienelactone hydrolase